MIFDFSLFQKYLDEKIAYHIKLQERCDAIKALNMMKKRRALAIERANQLKQQTSRSKANFVSNRMETEKTAPVIQFLCTICDKKFCNESSLINHGRMHSMDRSHGCHLCTYRFHNKSDLRHHLNLVHLENPPQFKCSRCYKIFRSIRNLIEHHKQHPDKDPVEVSVEEGSKVEVTENVQNLPPIKSFACSICGKTFPESRKLIRHMLIHNATGNRPFQCHLCHKRFSERSKLNRHIAGHTKRVQAGLETTEEFPAKPIIKSRKCEICSKEFPVPSRLKRHMIVHTKTNPTRNFYCKICGKGFSASYNVARHVVSVHANNQDQNQFPVETSQSELEVAEKIQSIVKSFSCEICGKKCKSRWGLSNHMIIHSKNDQFIEPKQPKIEATKKVSPTAKSFFCDLCGRGFTTRYGLSRHMNVHTRNLQFQCLLCDRRFWNRLDLRRHLDRIHVEKPAEEGIKSLKKRPKPVSVPVKVVQNPVSNESKNETTTSLKGATKRFSCKICGKIFSNSYGVNRHMVVHTGIRPFQCHICPVSCGQRYDLKRHLETVHGNKETYICDFCGKKMKNKRCLHDHMKEQHVMPQTLLKCPFGCGIDFKSLIAFKVHRTGHFYTDENFACDLCEKTYKQKDQLRSHMRVHVIGGNLYQPRNVQERALQKKIRQQLGRKTQAAIRKAEKKWEERH